MWNHATDDGKRTNNNVEGFNYFLNMLVDETRPRLFKLIHVFQAMQESNEREIEKLRQGEITRYRKNKYKKIDTCIKRLRDFYEQGKLENLEFLDSIGSCIKLN